MAGVTEGRDAANSLVIERGSLPRGAGARVTDLMRRRLRVLGRGKLHQGAAVRTVEEDLR
jgi:hypothetical protein